MIKKILIIFTVSMLMVVSSTPAIAQRTADSNGNGNISTDNRGNGNVKNDNHANGMANNDNRGIANNENPPTGKPAVIPDGAQIASSSSTQNTNSTSTAGENVIRTNTKDGHGFDDTGYNRTARIFNGIAWDWCMEKVGDDVWCEDYLGESKYDHLVMKWNAEWDRGNDEDWKFPPYAAWENNQWNGNFPGGSGDVWHYKIVWSESCAKSGTPDHGGYCIWGQFAVIMDQGTLDGAHLWLAHGIPTGYGSNP